MRKYIPIIGNIAIVLIVVIFAYIQFREPVVKLAGTKPFAGATYNLAGSGVTGSATSITLQSLDIPQNGLKIRDSDLSEVFYVTIDPGRL